MANPPTQNPSRRRTRAQAKLEEAVDPSDFNGPYTRRKTAPSGLVSQEAAVSTLDWITPLTRENLSGLRQLSEVNLLASLNQAGGSFMPDVCSVNDCQDCPEEVGRHSSH